MHALSSRHNAREAGKPQSGTPFKTRKNYYTHIFMFVKRFF
jgi:hypothetical protein